MFRTYSCVIAGQSVISFVGNGITLDMFDNQSWNQDVKVVGSKGLFGEFRDVLLVSITKKRGEGTLLGHLAATIRLHYQCSCNFFVRERYVCHSTAILTPASLVI